MGAAAREISQIRLLPPSLPPFLAPRCQGSAHFISFPCANCFLCWKKQSRTGEGKSLVTLPAFLLPASSAGRPSGKVSQSGGEDERKNRRERMNVHNKSLPLPSLIPGGRGGSYHHRHEPPDEWKRRGALYFVACARGTDSDIRFLPECRCRG